MNAITPNDLKEIQDTDQFLIIPFSTQKYAKELKLSEKATLAFFYVTALSIKRAGYMNKQGVVRIRFSLSHLLNSGLIKSKSSASKAIKELREKKVLMDIDVNNHGTSYVVTIDKVILDMRMKRKVTTKNRTALEMNDQKISKETFDNTEVEKQIIELKNQVDDIDLKLKEFAPGVFGSIKEMLGKKIDFTPEYYKLLDDKDTKLRTIKSLEDGLKAQSAKELRPRSLPKTQPKTFKNKSKPQTIAPKIIHQIFDNVSAIKNIANKNDVVAEITWALRFGWYSRQDMKMMHSVNHAIKMVSENDWRTPFGYNPKNIIGLVKYALGKRECSI